MKVINWRIKTRIGPSEYIIIFWSRFDSNSLTFKTISLDEDKLRAKIEAITGNKHFTLVHTK